MGAFKRHRVKRKDLEAELSAVLDLFSELKRLRSRKAETLSGGEQQMVALGRGLLGKPRLLMLDEPSVGLAPLVKKRVFATLKTMRDELGVTILLAEHETRDTLRIADRCCVMHNGQVVLKDKACSLLECGRVEEIYLGKIPSTINSVVAPMGASCDSLL